MTAKAPHERRAFSRALDIKRVPEGGLDMKVTATEPERVGLAAELGLPAIAALQGTFEIGRIAGGRFRVEGRVEATVTQTCVVTLDPFESTVEQPVDLTFAPARTPRDAEGGARHARAAPHRGAVGTVGDVDADDPPDPMYDETIDLGVVASEFLALALDPYPKKPGVQFDEVTVGDDDAPKPSAFAALERLRARS